MYFTRSSAALMVLTAITVAVAYVDLGVMNTVVAMGIAVTKATLVILFFMHVRWSDRLTGVVVASSFVWLIIMLTFTLSDYLSTRLDRRAQVVRVGPQLQRRRTLFLGYR